MRKFYNKIKSYLMPVIITLVVVIIFHTVFMLGYVPTRSMEPTLETESLILGFRLYNELKKGDIIIFRHEDSYLVKRIAAVEGDTVEHNGIIITVPKDHFYVLGDNPAHSYDSRYWEEPFVFINDVMAKVIFPVQ